MMKRHLLFAMLCIVGALKMSAQDDITSTYLTNADLSTVGTGWTYYSDAYKYGAWRNHNTETLTPCVEFYAGWGSLEHTDFKFSQTVTLPAGDYRIAVNAFFRNTNDGDGTNPNRAWIFAGTKTQNVVGLTNGGLTQWNSAGDDMDKAAAAFKSGAFSNAFDFTLTEETTIELGFQGRFAAIRQWCILGPVKLYKYSLENYLVDYRAALSTAQGIIDGGKQMDADVLSALQAAMVAESTLTTSAQVVAATNTLNDAIAAANASIAKYEAIAANEAAVAGASATNPITTNFVVNPTFSNGTSPWQSTTGASNQGTASNQTAFPNLPFWENWHSGGNYTGKMYQVIENIPNGVYELDMWAFVNHFGDGTQQYIFANGDKTYLTQGAPLCYKVFTEVTNNTIEIGLEQSAAVNEWMGLDDAVLIYYGDQISVDDLRFAEYIATVADLKAQIRAITAIPSAVTTSNETTLSGIADTYTTAADYEAAIATLRGLLTNTQAIETAFAEYVLVKANADDLVAAPNDNATANGTFSTAVSDANTAANAATTTAAIASVVADLKAAMTTYCNTANPTDETQPFDMTFMLTNPDVTKFWDGTWGVRPEGWYNDQNGGNFQVMANNEMGPGGEVFMEYWRGDAAQSGFVLYQKVTLPEGTYKMTGRVGLQQIGDGATGTTPNMTFSANDTDGSQIAVGPLADQEVEFINSINQEVMIGIKAHAGNCYRWIGINKIRLYKYPTDNTEFAIGVNATNATVNVSVEGVDGATAAKKLDAVNFTVAPDVNCVIESITVTYVDGDNTTQTITPTDLGNGAYTFQMPAFDVTITVVASVDKTALQGVIADAQAFDATSVPAQVLTPLTQALNAAIAVNEDTGATAQEVADAQQALFGALQDALNFAVPYAAYLELKDYADALVAVANDNAGENSTFAQAISTAETDISTVTTAADAADVNAALRAAMDTYATLANPQGDGAKFDLTYMVQNPDVTDLWVLSDESDPYSGAWWVTPEGWGTEQEGGNFQVMRNADADAADGVHNVFTEYYYLDNNSTWGNNKFNVYTSVEGLPAGTYNMSCYAFAREQNYSSGNPNPQVYFFANDTQGSLVNSTTMAEQSIEFVNNASQDVKIGLKPLEGNTYNWMGIGYVKLYKVPAKAFIIDEDDDDYDYTQEGAGDVIIRNRTIKEGYNTLVLPFSMTQSEVEQVFGQGAKISVVASYDVDKEHLRFIAQEGVVANRPCLLNATQPNDGSDILIEGRTLVPASSLYPTYGAPNVVMTGTYETQTYVPENSWFMQSGNLVYAPNGTSCWVNLGRAYITLDDGSHPVKGLTVSFEDGATGIAIIENGEMNILTGKIYDLSGREVQNPTRGIYIINGKKVMIK